MHACVCVHACMGNIKPERDREGEGLRVTEGQRDIDREKQRRINTREDTYLAPGISTRRCWSNL